MRTNLQNLFVALDCSPWAIVPQAHQALCRFWENELAQLAAGRPAAAEPSAAAEGKPKKKTFWDHLDDMARQPASVDDNGVGHVNIVGTVGADFAGLGELFGNTGTGTLLTELDQFDADPAVGAVMLHLDSPGGQVAGTPEVAERIAALGKPCFGFVDSGTCASAAYWMASAADRLYASPSAGIGSIGVYQPILDSTAAFDQMGLKVELVTNQEGTYKGAGYPGTRMSDAQKDQVRASVQETFNAFAAAVRTNRPQVGPEAMRGQLFGARSAAAAGLIDGVTGYAAAYRTLRSQGGRLR